MAVQPIDVTGGESVYCFNKLQLTSAFELAESEGEHLTVIAVGPIREANMKASRRPV